ncbi:MAG: AI-2E family transporter, partial [Oscillospiraceae bacterium]|nr:AI-2E family transporter [Oscillospiraceae bacterium]
MEEPEFLKAPQGETWQERAQRALWTFLTIAAVIVFYYLIQYLGTISSYIGTILKGISPVIWGLVFAYLLAPIASFYERNMTELIMRHKAAHGKTATDKTAKRIRIGSSILTLLTAIAFIALLLLLIIPEIYNSISGIVKALPSQIENLTENLEDRDFFDTSTTLGKYANGAIVDALESVKNWLLSDVSKQATKLMEYFYTGVKGVFNVVYNLVIGLILSLYVTIDREKLQNQIKKLTYAALPQKRALSIRIMFNRANKKLSTAIRGKIVDSMIIGMIHFVMLSIANLLPWFNYPYPVLLAVLVGLTNVVPFFGPIVGAFITGLLVLFENPSMTIPYVIMVVILQQFDSNFLDPHIVGGSIGLRPFWSISACLLGSAILGVPGFVLGPPIVSFVYEIVREGCNQRLRAKQLGEMFHLPSEEELHAMQEAEQTEVQPEAKVIEQFMQSNA